MGKKRSKATCKQKHAKAAAFSSSLKKTVRSVHRGGTTRGQRSRIESSGGGGGGGGCAGTTNGASSSPRRRGSGGADNRRPDATRKWTGPQHFNDQRQQRRPAARSGNGNGDDGGDAAEFAREVASLNEREGRDRVKREQALLARKTRAGGVTRGATGGGGGATGGAGGESLFGCPSGATFGGEGGGAIDIVHDAADRVASGLRVEGARSSGGGDGEGGGALASDAVFPRGHPWGPVDQRSKWIMDQERSREAEERSEMHARRSGNRYAAFADLDSEEEDDVGVDGGGREARGKKVAAPLTFAPASFQFSSTATTSRCELRREVVDPDL